MIALLLRIIVGLRLEIRLVSPSLLRVLRRLSEPLLAFLKGVRTS